MKENKVIKIAELIRERKWDLLIVIALLTIIAVMTPLSVNYIIEKAIGRTIEPLSEAVIQLERRQIDDIIERGVAGYKKVDSIEKLESSTQNAASIRLALKEPKAREILYKIDMEKTMLFEEYFFSGQYEPQ